LKLHKPWFVEDCSKLIDKRKAKLRWLQNSGQENVVKLNTVRHENSRTLRYRSGNIRNKKINELKQTVG
jgi:hypothetical protein